MTQSEFAKHEAGKSQCNWVLRYLEMYRNCGLGWAKMPDISSYSGSLNVHSRIADLRKRGHVIKQRTERKGGKVMSFYRLEDGK